MPHPPVDARSPLIRAQARDHALRSLAALHEPDDIVELRILNARERPQGRPHTLSGYFDDWSKLVEAALLWESRAPAIHITLNRINRELFHRSPNVLTAYPDATTSDAQVARRTAILLDADPVRLSGISSTDRELVAAKEFAWNLRDWLMREFGWRAPIEALSGNGFHLVPRIDLPNDPASAALVKAVLAAMAARWDNEMVHLDQTTDNAARLVKLWGTVAGKGAHTPERPHRRSQLLAVPECEIVTVEQLTAVAALAPRAERPRAQSVPGSNVFDLEQWLARHSLVTVGSAREWDGGRKYVLEECPFCGDRQKAIAGVRADGALVFACVKPACKDRDWRALRELKEPKHRAQNTSADQNGHKEWVSAEGTTKSPWQPTVQKASDLLQKDLPAVRWAVPDLIAEGLTIIAAKPKFGTSVLMVNIALSVVAGAPALGHLETQRAEWLYLALEDNERRMQKRLLAMRGPDEPLPDGLHIAYQWLPLDHGGLSALKDYLTEHPAIRGVTIDTLAPIRGGRRLQDSVYADDYGALRELHALANLLQVAIVVVHHTRKGAAEDPLDEVSGSTGLTAAADNIVVLRTMNGVTQLARRGRDYEDDTPIKLKRDPAHLTWQWCGPADEQLESEQRAVILKVLREAREPMRRKQIAEATGMRDANVGYLLGEMVKAGQVVQPRRFGPYSVPGRSPAPSNGTSPGADENVRDVRGDNGPPYNGAASLHQRAAEEIVRDVRSVRGTSDEVHSPFPLYPDNCRNTEHRDMGWWHQEDGMYFCSAMSHGTPPTGGVA
jgi:hypothetical protein